MAKLTAKTRDDIANGQFAFLAQRKKPLENAHHVRNAIARFNPVQGVSDVERDAACKHIQSAAKSSASR